MKPPLDMPKSNGNNNDLDHVLLICVCPFAVWMQGKQFDQQQTAAFVITIGQYNWLCGTIDKSARVFHDIILNSPPRAFHFFPSDSSPLFQCVRIVLFGDGQRESNRNGKLFQSATLYRGSEP